MEKRTKGCLLIGLGVFLLLLMVGVAVIGGAGYWLYHQFGVETAQHTPEEASREMDAIRARFGDQKPLIVVEGEGEARVDLDGPPHGNGQPLDSLHIVTFDPGQGELVRFTVPFWLVRLAPDGKISIGDDVLREVKGGERLTATELEAVGPALLIDERREDGHRVIVWTD